jgi:hypothetical protein
MLHFVFMSGRTTIYKIDYSLFVQLILRSLQTERRLRKLYIKGVDIRLA